MKMAEVLRGRWLLLVALVAMLGVSAGGGAAVASQLIGSKEIANGSIRSVDVHNHSLKSVDVRGGLAPVPTAYEWTSSFTADGTLGLIDDGRGYVPLYVSDRTLPARAHVQGVDVSVTGDFSGCKYPSLMVGVFRPAGSFNKPWGYFDTVGQVDGLKGEEAARRISVDDVQLRADKPSRLAVVVICYTYDDATDEYSAQPVPSFTATMAFTVTRTAAGAPHPFD